MYKTVFYIPRIPYAVNYTLHTTYHDILYIIHCILHTMYYVLYTLYIFYVLYYTNIMINAMYYVLILHPLLMLGTLTVVDLAAQYPQGAQVALAHQSGLTTYAQVAPAPNQQA